MPKKKETFGSFSLENKNEPIPILLSSLPNISKWNLKQCKDISDMFTDCISLSYLPDPSKWDFSSIKDKSSKFKKRFSLINLIDESSWNLKSDNEESPENIKKENCIVF